MPGRLILLSTVIGVSAAWLLGAAAVVQLLLALRRLRGTTLIAPVAWAVAAVCMLVVSATSGEADASPNPYLNFAAALLLLAPGLAVLGAKRPQHTAWQFIVLSFVGILLLPALNGLAAGMAAPQPHALFRWLSLAVFLVGTLNYLPTVRLFPIAIAWIGVGLMLLPWLPGRFQPTHEAGWIALICLNAGLAVGWAIALHRSRAPRGLERLWTDFRDAYGAVWGLRVAERLNVAARRHGWPVTFTWRGIRVASADDAETGPDCLPMEPAKSPPAPWNDAPAGPNDAIRRLDPELVRRIRREFHALLRRFVSAAWIAERDEPETGDFRRRRGVSAASDHTK